VRLENTRGSDLKNLIQVLTPNLVAGSLASALEALLHQYKSNIEILVQIDPEIEDLDEQRKLGVYRIVEQAVLNALIHGPAKNVRIELTTHTDAIARLSISDDGPGVALTDVSPGVGSAVIDSWVGILNGSRTIHTSPGQGYRLNVEFTI
jgi:signal transduction histidine kinase